MMKILKCFRDKVVNFLKWTKQCVVSVLKWIVRNIKLVIDHINTILFFTLIATILGGLLVNYLYNDLYKYYRFKSKPFLTFESDYTQVFRLSKEVKDLKYSVGESKWQDLTTECIVFGGNCGKLLLKGNSETGTNGATIVFGTNADVICTGDLYTLVDCKHFKKRFASRNKTQPKSKAKFKFLFKNCTQLVVSPEMSSVELADSCYYELFSGCVSLKKASELPAIFLKKSCYSKMFMDCSSLEEPPTIRVDNMAARCCLGMFKGCSSLKEAPTLNPSTMAPYCCHQMFRDCISLEKAPELKTKYLAEYCYSNMFEGCTSLKNAPKNLTSTQLHKGCYSMMFKDCTSLERAPELGNENLAESCYSNMFEGCTSLQDAPMLPAKSLVDNCYKSMFLGCISLKQITMLAIDINNKNQFTTWLKGAATKSKDKTMYKNKKATWEYKDIIPSDWKVFDYDDHK